MEPRDYGPYPVPHRIKRLDDALSYIAAHDGVWFATGCGDRAGMEAIGGDVLTDGRQCFRAGQAPSPCPSPRLAGRESAVTEPSRKCKQSHERR